MGQITTSMLEDFIVKGFMTDLFKHTSLNQSVNFAGRFLKKYLIRSWNFFYI